MYPVITISREFGSGGHSIAKKVSEKLGIPFYDSEIVDKTAEETGYPAEAVKNVGEYTNRATLLLEAIAGGEFRVTSPQDVIFKVQSEVIENLAKKGPCIIVGRCAHYVLEQAGIPNLHVMIHADTEHRKARIAERYEDLNGVSPEDRLRQKDKQRKTYVKYHTGREWGDFRYNSLALDTGVFGEEFCVDIICRAAEELNK